MKAMILAAGLGTRLRPWTLEHPKALVPVGGIPMLERVIESLKLQGFDEIVVNIHHFGEQILDFLAEKDFGIRIDVSDERGRLLDTGGGILAAGEILFSGDEAPFLVHNVDILSNADLESLMRHHEGNGNDVTLLTSDRDSSRRLIFDDGGVLRGWHNLSSDEYRPAGFLPSASDHESAFSGIYVIGKRGWERLKEYSEKIGTASFPIMDFFLSACSEGGIGEFKAKDLHLIDIGKPASLKQADLEFSL